MKKTWVCILISLLLILNTQIFFAKEIMVKKENQVEQLLETKDYDYIEPTFFQTWENKDFTAAFGYKSIVYNEKIYQIVRLGEKDGYVVVNDTICVVKHDAVTGETLKFNIYDGERRAGPEAIVEHKNQIYVLGSYLEKEEENNSFILVYDLNLNLNKTYYFPTIVNYTFYPIDMTSDGNDIYVTGKVKTNGENRDVDIFVTKFDTNLNLVWNITWDYNNTKQEIGYTGSIIETYDNYVYITGSACSRGDAFLLKILKDNGSSNFIIEKDVYRGAEGAALAIANDELYASYSNTTTEGSNINLCIYDTDLNLESCKTFNTAQIQTVEDMVVTDTLIFITGTLLEFNPLDPLNLLISNGYILRYNLEDSSEDWTKLVKEKGSYSFSINCDNNFLYISGAITKIIGLRLYSFILKCSKQGKSKLKSVSLERQIPNIKNILTLIKETLISYLDIKILFKKEG